MLKLRTYRNPPLLLALLIVFIGLAIPNKSNCQQAVPGNATAWSVLIQLGNGATGSGFFLNDGKAIYLVTAKHVLFAVSSNVTSAGAPVLASGSASLISYSGDPYEEAQNLITLDLGKLQSNGNIKVHPQKDVVVVSIGTDKPIAGTSQRSISMFAGATLVKVAKSGFMDVGIDHTATFAQVFPGIDVFVFGYPNSLSFRQSPQIDYTRPLLRKGILAGVNPSNKTLILDCPVYFGNSGGPVVERIDLGNVKDFKIIGVVVEFIPFIQEAQSNTLGIQLVSNSGYSVAIPMDFVYELIK